MERHAVILAESGGCGVPLQQWSGCPRRSSNPAMKLHILSDLHLSTGPVEPPETGADLVVLAGDLARPREALAWATRFEAPVLYVPGNHEFYGGSLDGTVHELRRGAAGTNVQILDNDEFVWRGVRFLGSTLWTDFRLDDSAEARAHAISEAQRLVRDFSRIRTAEAADALFSPAESTARFDRNTAWLDARLRQPFAGSTVVITHHSPSPRSIHPRFAGSPLNAAFVSDAEWLLGGTRAALWIHGHLHDSFDYLVRGTRVVCNPRGYCIKGANENPRFDPGLTLEIDAPA